LASCPPTPLLGAETPPREAVCTYRSSLPTPFWVCLLRGARTPLEAVFTPAVQQLRDAPHSALFTLDLLRLPPQWQATNSFTVLNRGLESSSPRVVQFLAQHPKTPHLSPSFSRFVTPGTPLGGNRLVTRHPSVKCCPPLVNRSTVPVALAQQSTSFGLPLRPLQTSEPQTRSSPKAFARPFTFGLQPSSHPKVRTRPSSSSSNARHCGAFTPQRQVNPLLQRVTRKRFCRQYPTLFKIGPRYLAAAIPSPSTLPTSLLIN